MEKHSSQLCMYIVDIDLLNPSIDLILVLYLVVVVDNVELAPDLPRCNGI
jgi:hypothetical protein